MGQGKTARLKIRGDDSEVNQDQLVRMAGKLERGGGGAAWTLYARCLGALELQGAVR